jgi:hypothetical protein
MMRGSHKLAEMFQKVIDSGATTLKKIIGFGEAYQDFFRTYPNYFRMIHYSQLPYFQRQVSAEMRGTCGVEHQKVWDLVFGIFRKGVEENIIRSDLNPAELAIIIWSSSTALMLRIDNEHQVWKERMNIDLQNTLQLSNRMLFEAMLTDVGRAQMQAVN